MLSGNAKLAGVLGYPVAHSLSPRLHSYWLDQLGIDGAYVPLHVSPEDLADVVRTLPKMGFAGFNLTVPHKEAVLPMLDEIDDAALAIGAVNTVIVQGGRLLGTNTDAYGFIEYLKESARPERKTRAVVLGAGGAARAIVWALLSAGYGKITLVNRTLAKAESLAAQHGAKMEVAPWEKRSEVLEGADLLVNTTTLGMKGKEPLDLDLSLLSGSAVVCDIVYSPLATTLLKKAEERGNPTVDGLGMLMHQAVPGFAAWFGKTPKVTGELRKHLIV